MKSKTKGTLTVPMLVLMILSTIFGFGNVTVAFDQMGYASIIWYVLAALVFFLPTGLMFAEYGSSFSSAKGGIYSWLKESVNEKFAFIGTFIWLSAWVIWMISTSSKVWIPFSNIIFGKDVTLNFRLFGFFTPMQTVGILGMLWIIVITFFTCRGFSSVAKISEIGGIFSILLPVIFAVMSLIVLFVNGGHLAEPITGVKSFIVSPNPLFVSPIAIMSFVVYAIFAYGGMESMGGIIDQVKNPKKNFPLGIIIASIIMATVYAVCIFLVGVTANWHSILGKGTVDLGNITYVLLTNLGYVFTKTLGFSTGSALMVGRLMARFAGLCMFVAYLGSFFVLVYSPIKSFIEGSDPKLWPEKVRKVNKHGMPANAMWIQAVIVVLFIFMISFSGNNAQNFYQVLTNMANISSTAPYLFLVAAFPFFKNLKNIDRPFVFFKNKTRTNIMVGIILVVLSLGIGFTAIEPILTHDYISAFWTIIGPVAFGLMGWLLYEIGIRRAKKVSD